MIPQVRKSNEDMTLKTKYLMYPSSLLYGLSIAFSVPYMWRYALLVLLTIALSFLIDEPIRGRVRKTVTVFLFLFFVGTLMGLVLMVVKLLILLVFSGLKP
ncbi:hypothetical protein PM3016_1077 [Paenibacillus mucilaginosus 3016]|uniref:Uncharacterized protein n=1 Tax=Paenibacillus mucilaginosus 3016 TaxID=1116391 RepID=H6NBY1_9BACL|nr:hypothetical protein [Paenibacillus mucilaginosus]AFC28013.1 hypothetical protein PM3016_1077 [Paenibacillus mucilaginosus 3016]WFA16866.1 hypothetical protein ERY13_05710 [Paenibacillus mucilaginosus]